MNIQDTVSIGLDVATAISVMLATGTIVARSIFREDRERMERQLLVVDQAVEMLSQRLIAGVELKWAILRQGYGRKPKQIGRRYDFPDLCEYMEEIRVTISVIILPRIQAWATEEQAGYVNTIDKIALKFLEDFMKSIEGGEAGINMPSPDFALAHKQMIDNVQELVDSVGKNKAKANWINKVYVTVGMWWASKIGKNVTGNR